MRAVAVILLLLALALSGCSDGGGGGDGGGDPDGAGPGDPDRPAAGEPVPLRFVAQDRDVLTDSFTVTVGPSDACVPGCALYSAAAGEASFIKEIDFSSVLPQGLHAFVEVSASYQPDASDAVDTLGNWNLQWYGRDLWVSGTEGDDAAGNATISGYVTNHGPDPATLILVVLEPDGGAQDVEVTVRARATPLDDAVHRTHVVGVGLGGGAVPVTTELAGEGTLQVRGPDDAHVLTTAIQNGTTVALPGDSPPGEYRFVVFGADGPTRFLVPEANLTSPTMRLLDTTQEDGEARDVPPNGALAWDVELQRPPYYFQVRFDGLDGRSTYIDAHLTVTAPDGTKVIDDDVQCDTCVYSLMGWGALASDSFVAGTYKVQLDVEAAQGWTVAESVGLYGR